MQHPAELKEALGIPFSPQQLTAITAPLEPGVIIAGAGSGKTTVMAARVVWLVATGQVRPEQVLGLTFTRKAAAELSERVASSLERSGAVAHQGADEAGEQLVMTYDAFAARLVAEHGLRVGVDADPRMITGATRFRLAGRVVNAAAGPFEELSGFRPATIVDRVLRLDAELTSHLVDRRALDRQAGEFAAALAEAPLARGKRPYVDVLRAEHRLTERLELAGLVAEYQALKRRLGVVEFADQMAIAARLAHEIPEVSSSVRRHFAVVLLDEYQDTSAAQAMFLRGLFSGVDAADGCGHPVTAVGDPLQAIYGWRGAAASNITQFATDFPAASGRPARGYALTVNRRSGKSILDVANALSASLRADGEHGDDLEASERTGPGHVAAATFETWPEEIAWIGDEIVRARGEVTRWSDLAVLTRRNADIGALFAELTRREIPAEIVGLGGLLSLPEISDVLSTLRLLDDVTANPELVRLLSGVRWRIGAADLARLGRRARSLARRRDPADDPGAEAVDVSAAEAAAAAVAGLDPSESVCLLDALDSPGEGDYSAAARERFAALSAELAGLRRHLDEPVLDLVRRVIAVIGVDVELVATPEAVRTSRRDQLAAFVDAVAGYIDVDGEASLGGLLGYLRAELEAGNGLDQAVPTDADSVKLLTVHRAKGLEWERVFLPALVHDTFPSDRVTDNWVTNAAVVPAELRGDAGAIPQVEDVSKDGFAAYAAALKNEQRRAEDRLAYVAVTRAKQMLIGTGHHWRAGVQNARKLSGYLEPILLAARDQGLLWAEATPPEPGATNPLDTDTDPVDWPAPLDEEAWRRRHRAAAAVEAARQRRREGGDYVDAEADPLPLDEESVVAQWDADLELLVAEAIERRRPGDRVVLPSRLTATEVVRLEDDPQGFAADLLRPMPRRPSRRARFGTAFHQWVERHYGQAALLDPAGLDESNDAEDDAIEQAAEADERRLAELCERFAAGRFGDRTPVALEAPFSLVLGERLVRGRIDAVFADLPPDSPYEFQLVDWKTGRRDRASALQLAVYRLAWARLHDVDPERVQACFYFVGEDRIVTPSPLPGERELARLVAVGQGD